MNPQNPQRDGDRNRQSSGQQAGQQGNRQPGQGQMPKEGREGSQPGNPPSRRDDKDRHATPGMDSVKREEP